VRCRHGWRGSVALRKKTTGSFDDSRHEREVLEYLRFFLGPSSRRIKNLATGSPQHVQAVSGVESKLLTEWILEKNK
jgi:hypothetical protein